MDETSFKQRLKNRKARFVKSLCVAAVLTIPLVLTSPFFLLLAWIHAKMVDRCCSDGKVIEATVRQLEPDLASETFIEQISREIPLVEPIFQQLQKYMLVHFVHSSFEHEGRKISTAQYTFGDEQAAVDENGNAHVIFDPRHPKLVNFIVTEQTEIQ